MKYIFSILFILCSAHFAMGQGYTVKGTVMDTLNNTPLHRASLVLIRVKDSVIEAHTRTAPNGTFEIHVANKGKYLLRISFPSFVDYLEVLDVKKNTIDLGEKPMVSKEHLLKEFVLTQQIAAIKIKGDTTEYMADSFKVKENATVEDLLKRLPGIQVDKNGNVTAQGETVTKILVDGEEFFSDDPKVVTQSLQANAVSKVQVYDKKSDQAEFTGIDDGQKTKTINLELKEDKKKGYFGKLDVGAGTDGYYQEQGMINAFRAKWQASAFAIASNTDKVGLGWQDNDKFGGGNGVTEIVDGSIMTTYSSSDEDFSGWGGRYNGQGLPRSITGGAHFADKWNKDKNHTTENYRYALQNVDIDGGSMVQNTLNDTTMAVTDQHKTQSSRGERHSIDAMYEIKIDTNTSIKITANAGLKNTDTRSVYDADASVVLSNEVKDTLNSNHRDITSKANADFINADLLLKKKFAKKGRTISLDIKENFKESKSEGILNSTTHFFFPGSHDSVFNQQKKNTNSTTAFAAKATYTEPLSKKIFAEVDYGITVNNNEGENNSYDINNNYALDSNYSSHFSYNILSNTGGLNFKYVSEKINISVGSDVSNANYLQTDFMSNTTNRYNYLNLFPKANFTYNLSKQTSVKISYYGSTVQPSFTQTQPLKQNSDPLNITIGNPGLAQGFDHRADIRFNDYKILSNRYLWGSISFTYHDNAISTKRAYINGVNTTQYINVNGNYNTWGYVGYGFKIKKINLDVGIQLNASLYHLNNQIGTQQPSGVVYRNNSSDNNTMSFAPYFSYNKTDKFELTLEPRYTYNSNRSTIGINSTNYSMFNCEFKGTVQLPLKFEIGSSVDVMIREKTTVFTSNNDVVKWNAWVGKKFLKKSQLELRASVFDILDQNIGYERNATGTTVTQENYNTIRRYGMLNLIWNFTHTPAGAPAPANGNMIIIK